MVSDIRRRHPLFSHLTFKGSSIIFRQCSILRLRPSQILFKEGQRDRGIYIILEGRLALRTKDGGVLGVLGIGESAGEEAFLLSNFQTDRKSVV